MGMMLPQGERPSVRLSVEGGERSTILARLFEEVEQAKGRQEGERKPSVTLRADRRPFAHD